jgi:hypothetical protein
VLLVMVPSAKWDAPFIVWLFSHASAALAVIDATHPNMGSIDIDAAA